jgi:hypothetical protein
MSIYRVRRSSIADANAPRRALLDAVEIREEKDAAILVVAGEALLVLRSVDELLDAMGITRDDIELHGG